MLSRNSLEIKLSDVKDILIEIGNKLISQYENQDTLQKKYSEWFRENKNQLWPLEDYKFIDKQGVYSGVRGVHNPGKEGYRYDIIHPITQKPCKEPLMGYRFPKETMDRMINEKRIIYGETEEKLVEIKVYAKDYKQKLSSVINLDGRAGANELKDLFPETKKIFTNPKTIKLLKELTSFVCNDNDIILDFFAGSGSTAHAIMKLNSENEGQRKFILVQLPEQNFDLKDGQKIPKVGPAGEAFKAGYQNIYEIGKERICRAGEKILEENKGKEGIQNLDIDIGFKVFRVGDTNINWLHQDLKGTDLFEHYDKNASDKDKLDFTPDFTDLDVVYEIMLRQTDIPLSSKVEPLPDIGPRTYIFADSFLVCLEQSITRELVDKLAAIEPLPVKFIFRDSAFDDDISLKDETFRMLSALIERNSGGDKQTYTVEFI